MSNVVDTYVRSDTIVKRQYGVGEYEKTDGGYSSYNILEDICEYRGYFNMRD